MLSRSNLEKIHDWLWEIPKSYRGDMRVPARVYANEKMIDAILRIKERLGGLEAKKAIEFLNEDNTIESFRIFLKYYYRW